MRTNWTRAALLVAWTLLTAGALFAQAAAPSETLLPATTKGFVSTGDLNHLNAQWQKTQLGQLMRDPLMKPFADDLEGQLRQRFSEAYANLGLTWNDVKGVSSGEVAVARIQPAPGKAALVMIADVTGRGAQVDALAKKITENLAKQKAVRSEKVVGKVTVVHFDLANKNKRAFYFRTDRLLVTADDAAVIEEILARATGQGKVPTLSTVPAFRATMARCQKEVGNREPQVRWFVEPFGYAEVLEAADPDREAKRRKGKSQLEVLKGQGFTAIRGIGGFVDFAIDGYEVLHRTSIYAPPPYEKSAKMLAFFNRKDFTPQPWVPRDVATYATGYVDVLNAFDNFGPLFDDLFGEGKKGVWIEVRDGFEKDPNGPQINLRKELIACLGQRVTALTDYRLPITPNSERLLYAVETLNEKGAAKGIAKIMENDDNMKRRVFGPYVIWEAVEPTHRKPRRRQGVVVENVPSFGPRAKAPKPAAARPPVLPNAAVAVAHGQLFLASDIEFLKKILQQPEKGDSLGGRLDYELVNSTVNRFGVPDDCARFFSRTDEEYRPTYELIRQGKMPQSKTMFGRLLNRSLGSDESGSTRRQEIDGQKMPDYQVVRRHLGPGGTFVYGEPTGWFVVGFMLPK